MRNRRLAVVVALASLLSACQPAAVPQHSSEPIGARETSSLAPTGGVAGDVAAFERYTWEKASLTLEQYTLVTNVGSTPVGWVAVGVQINLPDPGASLAPDADPLDDFYSAVVWSSQDGRAWTQHPDGDEFDGARMTKVISAGPEALVFGLGGVCMPDACGGLPPNGGTIVWASSDGQTWDRLADTGLQNGAVVDAAAVEGGVVAVGFVANGGTKPPGDFSSPTDGAIWRSVDGHRWTQVARLPVVDRFGLVSAEGSRLLAVGQTTDVIAMWSSVDAGMTWSPGPMLADSCCDPPAINAGVAIVPSLEEDSAIAGVVHSADANSTSWTRHAPAVMLGIRPVAAQVIGTSFVVFGWTAHRDSEDSLVDDKPVAFASDDGIEWRQVPLPAGWNAQAPRSVAARGRDLVAVLGELESVSGSPGTGKTTMWIGTASD